MNINIQNNNRMNTILHINARSMRNKLDEISDLLHTLDEVKYFGITETWSLFDNVNYFPDFNYLFINRTKGKGGGVAIFFHKSITNVKQVHDFSFIDESCEVVTVENPNLIISTIYRPSYANINAFFNFLERLFSYGEKTNKKICIMGDLNMDLLNNDPITNKFLDLISSENFENVICEPTRVTEHSATLIDPIITNISNYISGIIKNSISDHFPTYIKIDSNLFSDTRVNMGVNKERDSFEVKDFSETNILKFKDCLRVTNWNEILKYDNINDNFNTFIDYFTNEYNKCFPLISIKKTKKFRKPWMNNVILKKIKYRNKLFHRFLKNKDLNLLKDFKNLRNQINKEILQAKKLYYSDLFVNKNTKQTWQAIYEINGSFKKKKTFNEFIDVGKDTINDLNETLNDFNDYFVNVGYNLIKNQSYNTNCCDLSYQNFCQNLNLSNSLYLEEIQMDELSKVVNDLKINKGPGYDGVHPKIIKMCSDELIHILHKLYNDVFKESIVPICLKISKITPIFKSGDRSQLSNYRPIAVSSVFTKIFERILYNRIYQFLEKYKILHINQYGFRKGKSTETAILRLLNYIQNNLDRKEIVLGLFMDLTKAFDVIDHKILLEKLKLYGIRGNENKLLQSYLEDRKQFVQVKNYRSNLLINKYGVPQGSVMGPLLFIIFLNDLFFYFNDTFIISYADDTSLFINNKDSNTLTKIAHEKIPKIFSWFKLNNLFINYKKTNLIYFFNKNKKIDETNLTIDGNTIKQVDDTNFLGITINKNLNWNTHINSVCGKLARNIGIIKSISSFLPTKVIFTLYFSFIFSVITYGITSWGQTTEENKNRINILLRRFEKILKNKNYNMQNVKIMNIHNIIEFKTCLLMFERIKYGNLNEIIDLNFLNHSYATRFKNNLLPIRVRTNLAFKGINSTGPRIWNSLPLDLQMINSKAMFKKYLSKYILENNNIAL